MARRRLAAPGLGRGRQAGAAVAGGVGAVDNAPSDVLVRSDIGVHSPATPSNIPLSGNAGRYGCARPS
jgi:hypothetical protein